MAKAVHKFEKVLAKHGFVMTEMLNKEFCGHKHVVYNYRNPLYKGRVSITVWDNGNESCHHYFVQSNGLTAPSICDTKGQLDRNLTRHYVEKKCD